MQAKTAEKHYVYCCVMMLKMKIIIYMGGGGEKNKALFSLVFFAD